MTQWPILFSGPMVRAILEDCKTQTRRVVKPQPRLIEHSGRWWWPIPARAALGGAGSVCTGRSREWHEYLPAGCCPYGEPGDLLWVRETWAAMGFDDTLPRDIPANAVWLYRAEHPGPIAGDGVWRPSIFMPKVACRLWLEVTEVRVERLQEIDEIDAKAEGAFPDAVGHLRESLTPHRDEFELLWDDINAERGHTWKSNPWVWAVSFERKTE